MKKHQMAFMLICLVASGCASPGKVPNDFQFGVDDSHFTFVRVAPPKTYILPNMADQTILSPQQKATINEALIEFHRRHNPKIRIIVPVGAKNESNLLRLKEMVNTSLRYSEVKSWQIEMINVASTKKNAGHLQLQVMGTVGATRRDCGMWPDDILNTRDTAPYHNFGCALNNNLAAQMENPNDQFKLRGMTPPDGGRTSRILKDYRSGTSVQSNTNFQANNQ